MANWEIRYFCDSDAIDWDNFVSKKSINGTFLQERRFLSYHEKERFLDCSLMMYYKGILSALIPACIVKENDSKIFFSHKGSTYGGPIVNKKVYCAEVIYDLLDTLETFLIEQQFAGCVLKPTLSLLCKEGMDLLEFCLCSRGYHEYKELELYVDYDKYNEDILSNFSTMKQRIVKKCIKAGIEVCEIKDDEEIEKFHLILSQNLEKYNTKPVHTVAELLDLKKHRLPDEINFYGAYLNDRLIAGTMVFHFLKSRCAHTQYLASDLSFNDLSPLSYIYYDMLVRYKSLGYKYLSWGITSEHLGTELNMGLTRNKENFGSIYMINHIYEKSLIYFDKSV